MKEGDKEGRREGDELMELLLGIFFALWWREALVCGHHHPTGRRGGPRSCKKLTPPLFANLKSHGNLRSFIVITSS